MHVKCDVKGSGFCMSQISREEIDRFQQIANLTKREVLWPNTPIGSTHQKIIKKRVGSYDSSLRNKQSRSYTLSKFIQLLPSRSISILDLGCGDAVLGTTLKKKFPEIQYLALDLFIGKFKSHEKAKKTGINLISGYMQNVIDYKFSNRLDIFIMLNSYRSWESAQLKQSDRDFPTQLDTWIKNNFTISIVSVGRNSIDNYLARHLNSLILGKGEDDSMIVASFLN